MPNPNADARRILGQLGFPGCDLTHGEWKLLVTVRAIAAVLELSWVHAELASYYPKIGRPSIDPVLMIRMLVVGYVFAIRSERALCREVQVNLAYRWFL